MCPCRLGIGSLSKALSKRRVRFCACFSEGIALDMDAEPACFEAVFRLNNNESKRNSSSGFVSEKNVCICMDKFCNWLIIILAPIRSRSVAIRNSLVPNSKNPAFFVVCRQAFLSERVSSRNFVVIELKFQEFGQLIARIQAIL